MKKSLYFIYVNFDRRTIGVKENTLDWKVGEETKVEAHDYKVMVYANLELTETAHKAVKLVFKKLCDMTAGMKFHEKVNSVVEKIIEITSDEATCDWIVEKAEDEERQRMERERRREEWLFDHVLEPFMRSMDKKIGFKL